MRNTSNRNGCARSQFFDPHFAGPAHGLAPNGIDYRLNDDETAYVMTIPLGHCRGDHAAAIRADPYSYDGAWLMTGLFVLIAGVTLAWFFKERLAES